MSGKPTTGARATDRSGPRYCVIGAGAAGIAALDALVESGVTVDGFERADRVGGRWLTTYESAHLLTLRDVSGFDGYPMPAHYPVYPSRDQMVAYLDTFARARELTRSIRFGTSVERVTPVGRAGVDGWRVATADGRERRYDGVVVATGYRTSPRQPTFAGSFSGKLLHAADYRDVDDLAGTRVLVVGSGNTGCDIAADAAAARLDTAICVRRGRALQPKELVDAPPGDAASRPPLPGRVARLLAGTAGDRPSLLHGVLGTATGEADDRPPVTNTLLPYWVQHGRVAVMPGIDRFDGPAVHFVDGTDREFDTIVLATGFDASFPFLDPSLMQWGDGVPLRVAAMTLPLGLERLYFVGLAAPRGPELPAYSQQARLVANLATLVDGRGVHPSQYFADREPPDGGIDLAAKQWASRLARANRELARLGRGRPTPVDVSPAASIWEEAEPDASTRPGPPD